jgi:hypothetical protein
MLVAYHLCRARADRELRDRLVRARIGLVVEDVHGAIVHFQKINVAGDGARLVVVERDESMRCMRCRAAM